MRISEFIGADVASIKAARNRVEDARGYGFDGCWFAQGIALDALSAIAVIGASVPDISLGTAVVPIQGRHPLPLALAARTAVSAAGSGRITLGIGVTHKVVSEGFFAIPYRGIVTACEETLVALEGFFGPSRQADVHGATLTARATLVGEIQPPSVMVAALGRRMLEVAGRHSDGTITWMTGVRTIGDTIRPALHAAAADADRPMPKIACGLPVCITSAGADAKDRIDAAMAGPAALPSYARMLAHEGVQRPVDIALVGTEDEVARRLDILANAGVDELIANIVGDDQEQRNTRSVLARLSPPKVRR